MRKRIILIVLMFGLVGSLFPKQPESVTITGQFLLTADRGIKGTYGNGIIYPEIRYNSGSLIYNELYLWAGMGYLALKSDPAGAYGEVQLTQFRYSLGFGYLRKLTRKWAVNVRIGGLGVLFKDESLKMEEGKVAFGGLGTVALVYDWNNVFYSELEVGYSFLSGKTDNDITVKPGGLKMAVGIGIKF